MSANSRVFSPEEAVIQTARDFLNDHAFSDALAREHMAALLNEYEKLFRRTMRMAKMGDRMQLRLSNLNETLRCRQEELCCLAATDPLTGLCNRRSFLELAEQERVRSERYGFSMVLLLMDLDNFKRINDDYGHDIGDLVLKHVSRILRDTLRQSDLLARFGGEEFIALLPETSMDGALVIAERLRFHVAEAAIQAPGGFLSITISIGAAGFQPCGSMALDVLTKRADEALYVSKKEGRNRATCSRNSPAE